MAQTTVSVRLDSEDKKHFEDFCNATGMNISVAINMFVKAVLREHRLPFEVVSNVPNSETIAAFDEVEQMRKCPQLYKGYTDVDKMMEELLS